MDTHLWTRSMTRALRLSQESGEVHVEENADPAPKRHCSNTTWTSIHTTTELEVDVGLDIVEKKRDDDGQIEVDGNKEGGEKDASAGQTGGNAKMLLPGTEKDNDTRSMEPSSHELTGLAMPSSTASIQPAEDAISTNANVNVSRKRSHVEMEDGGEDLPAEQIRLAELPEPPSLVLDLEIGMPATSQEESAADENNDTSESTSAQLEQAIPPSSSPSQAPSQDENAQTHKQEEKGKTEDRLHQTIVLAAKVEHDETSMLQDFLDRVRAEKASRKKVQAGPSTETKRASGPHLWTPLQALDVNSRSPSRSPSPEKTIKLQMAPAAGSDKARKRSTSRSDRAGTDAATPSTAAIASRRSQRQRQAASSARSTPAGGGATMIPVRRLGPVKPIKLVDSAAKELAALTKANTKRNRIETLPDKNAEVMESTSDEKTETTSDRMIRAASRKKVVWDEQLVYYEEKRDHENACEDYQASTGRRLRSRA